MNGAMRSAATHEPDAAPTLAHTPTATAAPRTMPAGPADWAPATSRMKRVAITDDRAIKLPTDRSTPPVTITMVIPIARIAMTAI